MSNKEKIVVLVDADQLENIEHMLVDIKCKLESLDTKDPMWKPKDIAEHENIKGSNIYGRYKFLMPNFGLTPEREWRRSVCLAHLSKGRKVLRQEYARKKAELNRAQIEEAKLTIEAEETAKELMKQCVEN